MIRFHEALTGHRFLRLLVIVVATTVESAWATAQGDMRFRPIDVRGRPGLSAVGRIAAGTPQAFVAAMAGRQVDFVVISSPGGDVAGSMRLGELFRHYRVTAIVAVASAGAGRGPLKGADCYSACVYAIMGALRRVVPLQSHIGIHEMAPVTLGGAPTSILSASTIADHAAMRAELERYSRLMGVEPSLVDAAERTPSGRLRLLTQDELKAWRFSSSHL